MNSSSHPSTPSIRDRHLLFIRNLLAISLLTSAVSLIGQPAGTRPGGGQGQRDYSKVEIKTTHISGSVYLLEGAGGNTGASVGPDGILIVDNQFLPLAEKIDAALAKLSTNKLEYVINTHIHPDHTGGNAYFGRKAKIIAHANLRRRLAEKTGVKPEELPVITHEQGLTLHFNGEEIRVLGFGPGHTDGDTAVFFTQSKVLQLGDQFVNGRFPFVDVVNGGGVKGLLKNLDSVLAWLPVDTKIIPGHGAVGTVDDLKRFRAAIAESVSIVEKGIAEGKTSEEIRATAPLEKFKEWSVGPQNPPRWFDAVYNSLTKKS